MVTYLQECFYINLDRRLDRRAEIEAEFEKIGLSVERFPAIDKNPGIVGCGLSHLAVLKMAKERGLKNVLIFEDDFQFLVSKEEFWTQMEQLFMSGVQYDVVMLGYSLEKKTEFNDLLYKVVEASTASAYLVNERFYDKLIELYENAIPLLIETGKHWVYANDQIWKSLQEKSNWFAFCTRIGKQRRSYSDLSLMVKEADH
jgi:glycosyl transferase family 25